MEKSLSLQAKQRHHQGSDLRHLDADLLETLEVVDERAVRGDELNVGTVRLGNRTFSRYSARERLVKPHFFEMMIFWRPGNLYWARRRASRTMAFFESLQRIERMIWPMLTRATVPYGLPHAPRIPVCSLSAPAHESILLIRMTWNGWARTRRWNESLPEFFTTYLLAQIR